MHYDSVNNFVFYYYIFRKFVGKKKFTETGLLQVIKEVNKPKSLLQANQAYPCPKYLGPVYFAIYKH